jgi:hypothetical protein
MGLGGVDKNLVVELGGPITYMHNSGLYDLFMSLIWFVLRHHAAVVRAQRHCKLCLRGRVFWHIHHIHTIKLIEIIHIHCPIVVCSKISACSVSSAAVEYSELESKRTAQTHGHTVMWPSRAA